MKVFYLVDAKFKNSEYSCGLFFLILRFVDVDTLEMKHVVFGYCKFLKIMYTRSEKVRYCSSRIPGNG
jgi:hypothetical protein